MLIQICECTHIHIHMHTYIYVMDIEYIHTMVKYFQKCFLFKVRARLKGHQSYLYI